MLAGWSCCFSEGASQTPSEKQQSILYSIVSCRNLHETIARWRLYASAMYEELFLMAGKANFYDELKEDWLLERYFLPRRALIAGSSMKCAKPC